MPTNKQRREAARRHLERQLVRRQEREAHRRKITLVSSIGGTIVLIAAIVVAVVLIGGGDNDTKKTTAAGTSTSPSAPAATSSSPADSFVAQKTTGACGYTTTDASANPSLKDVGLPPDPKAAPKNDLVVTFTTNRGVIQATLDGKDAPCNVQALAYLIDKKFYDNTPCPRVESGPAASSLNIVQCGSGSSSTAGGPTFTSPDENDTTADYAAGAIAMANTGQAHTGSSQFFFMTADNNKELAKSYSLVGHVTEGLSILQKVAGGGNDGSSQAGGGAPKLNLTFKTVRVTKVLGGGKNPGVGPKPTLEPAA